MSSIFRAELSVKFEGDLADSHRLPAHLGLTSIEGETFANLILLNYLAEGKVRKKKFVFENYNFNVVAQREGSFETVYEFVANSENLKFFGGLGVSIATGAGGNIFYEFLKDIKQRVVGKKGSESVADLISDGRIPPEDVDKLLEAIEPSTRRAYSVVNHGASNITININGDNNVVNFDASTKSYLWENVTDTQEAVKLFSISNYGANHGGGKAFDYDEGRLITFETKNKLDQKSIESMMKSISAYAMRKFKEEDSMIAAKFTSLKTVDGRLKKIFINKLRDDIFDL